MDIFQPIHYNNYYYYSVSEIEGFHCITLKLYFVNCYNAWLQHSNNYGGAAQCTHSYIHTDLHAQSLEHHTYHFHQSFVVAQCSPSCSRPWCFRSWLPSVVTMSCSLRRSREESTVSLALSRRRRPSSRHEILR